MLPGCLDEQERAVPRKGHLGRMLEMVASSKISEESDLSDYESDSADEMEAAPQDEFLPEARSFSHQRQPFRQRSQEVTGGPAAKDEVLATLREVGLSCRPAHRLVGRPNSSFGRGMMHHPPTMPKGASLTEGALPLIGASRTEGALPLMLAPLRPLNGGLAPRTEGEMPSMPEGDSESESDTCSSTSDAGACGDDGRWASGRRAFANRHTTCAHGGERLAPMSERARPVPRLVKQFRARKMT